MNTTNVSQEFISANWSEQFIQNFEFNEIRRIVLSKNYFVQDENLNFLERLNQIESRAASETLRLAVIGTFSSGKSTFINALLGTRFLISKNEATTATATHIRLGEKLSIKITLLYDDTVLEANEYNFKNIWRTYFSRTYESTKSFRDFFAELTANEEVASSISKVELLIPSDFKISNLEIIDTPGFNSGEKRGLRHKNLTKELLKDYADGVIVIIPAYAAAGDDLVGFLKENVPSFAVSDATFILSHADEIDEDELEDIVEYVGRQLKKCFNLENTPEVCPVNSVNELLQCEEKNNFWSRCFDGMLEKLKMHLIENREEILQRHLEELCKLLCSDLKNALSVREKTIRQEAEFIENHKISNIEKITQKLLADTESELAEMQKNEFSEYSESIAERINEDWDDVSSKCWVAIYNCISSNRTSALEREIKSVLSEMQTDWSELADERIEPMSREIQRIQRNFILEFERHYEGFQGLSSKIEISEISADAISFSNFSVSGVRFNDATGEMIGGAGVGALVGTFLLPGLGTVAGAALGGWFGKIFNEETDSEKTQKVWNKIFDSVSKWHDDVRDEIGKQIYLMPYYLQEKFKSLAEAHIRQYGEAVNEKIQIQKQELKKLKLEHRRLLSDVHLLNSILRNN